MSENYIHRLQREKAEAQKIIQCHEAAWIELQSYLLSQKFHEDPTVQTRDVLHRYQQTLDYARQQAGV